LVIGASEVEKTMAEDTTGTHFNVLLDRTPEPEPRSWREDECPDEL
jgi:hypothetical protein